MRIHKYNLQFSTVLFFSIFLVTIAIFTSRILAYHSDSLSNV